MVCFNIFSYWRSLSRSSVMTTPLDLSLCAREKRPWYYLFFNARQSSIHRNPFPIVSSQQMHYRPLPLKPHVAKLLLTAGIEREAATMSSLSTFAPTDTISRTRPPPLALVPTPSWTLWLQSSIALRLLSIAFIYKRMIVGTPLLFMSAFSTLPSTMWTKPGQFWIISTSFPFNTTFFCSIYLCNAPRLVTR